MRIQARLFLGTSLIVLALMSAQWWIHHRQLRQIERQLGAVATSVGQNLLMETTHVLGPSVITGNQSLEYAWVETKAPQAVVPDLEPGEVGVDVVLLSTLPNLKAEAFVGGLCDGSADAGRVEEEIAHRVTTTQSEESEDASSTHTMVHTYKLNSSDLGSQVEDESLDRVVRRLRLRVDEGQSRTERFLVVSNHEASLERKIPIPVSPTVEIFRSSFRSGLAIGVGLLAVGLVGSGVLARRVARPLRDLAERAEALGSGDLGIQVAESASGEVGELQGAFNRMSLRLVELEEERTQWRRREHLAQLGDLARGLAHTLRNPLNTLGLAVEELAGGREDSSHLVVTARGQIRRIDRWLRSFLAVSAGEAARFESCDVREIVESVALEAIQGGADLRLDLGQGGATVVAIPTAVRAAVANLVENAVQASPLDQPVEMSLESRQNAVRITILDRGGGVPREVRDRLFSPHVTTKPEGAGMGLFLARQLIVAMHDGRLGLDDRPGGGTVVTLDLPLESTPSTADGEDTNG